MPIGPTRRRLGRIRPRTDGSGIRPCRFQWRTESSSWPCQNAIRISPLGNHQPNRLEAISNPSVSVLACGILSQLSSCKGFEGPGVVDRSGSWATNWLQIRRGIGCTVSAVGCIGSLILDRSLFWNFLSLPLSASVLRSPLTNLR